jgi:hypothetical protein
MDHVDVDLMTCHTCFSPGILDYGLGHTTNTTVNIITNINIL